MVYDINSNYKENYFIWNYKHNIRNVIRNNKKVYLRTFVS